MNGPAIDAPEDAPDDALMAMKIAQRVGSRHPFRLGGGFEQHRANLAKAASVEATRATLEELAERISDGFAGLTKRVAQIEAARGVSGAGEALAKVARRPPSPDGQEWTELVSDGRVEVTYSPNGSVRKVRLLDGPPLFGMSGHTLVK